MLGVFSKEGPCPRGRLWAATSNPTKKNPQEKMFKMQRDVLEALAVENLEWQPRQAAMATIHVLEAALRKAGVSVSPAREFPPPPEVEPEPQLAPEPATLPPIPLLKIEPQTPQPPKKLPNLDEVLEDFGPVFKSVQSQLATAGKPTPRDFEPCPPASTRDLAQEIATLQAQITKAMETLQSRKVAYIVMRDDDTGVFTKKPREVFERMLLRNEAETEELREKLNAVSIQMHDATRKLRATGDRMYSLGLMDEQALSEWHDFLAQGF